MSSCIGHLVSCGSYRVRQMRWADQWRRPSSYGKSLSFSNVMVCFIKPTVKYLPGAKMYLVCIIEAFFFFFERVDCVVLFQLTILLSRKIVNKQCDNAVLTQQSWIYLKKNKLQGIKHLFILWIIYAGIILIIQIDCWILFKRMKQRHTYYSST